MSTQSNQTRARGFTPLFRGFYADQHLRVSDAERQAVADCLAEHFGEGRLDQAEFDERVGRAMNAKTRADFSGLLDDLPDTGAPAGPVRPRRRHGHPVLLLALIVLLAVAAAHAVAWAAWAVMPWLWIGVLAAVLLLVARAAGRSRPGRDR